MKKSKKRKLKGFAKLLSDSRKNNSNKKPSQEITPALTKLDAKKKDSGMRMLLSTQVDSLKFLSV